MSDKQHAELIGWICVAGICAAKPELWSNIFLSVAAIASFTRSFFK